MIKEFVELWNKNKNKLEEEIKNSKNHHDFKYKDLVKMLFDIVINADKENIYEKFDTGNISVIDNECYKGTQIFILCENIYDPEISNYIYTHTHYGSCGGCDTLLAIQECNNESDLPTEEQVKEYMTLCLHLLQKCNYMVDN